MAARANLTVDGSVRDAFLSAQTSFGANAVRWLRVEIDGEVMRLTDTGLARSAESAGEDMEALAADVAAKGEGNACYVVFCTDLSISESKPWILVAYVPETSKVRAKMLYASGREDLKRALGHTYFKGELHAGASSELSKEALRHTLRSGSIDLPYSEEEIIARMEKSSIHPGGEKVAVIAGVPLACSQGLSTRLDSFGSATNGSCLEIAVLETETFDLAAEHALSNGAPDLAPVVNEAEPRFYLIKVAAGINFLYFCPDGCKVKKRMLYSTAKAALTGHIENASIEVVKKAEVRDAAGLSDAFVEIAAPSPMDSSAATFSRPARPGRKKKSRNVKRHFQKK